MIPNDIENNTARFRQTNIMRTTKKDRSNPFASRNSISRVCGVRKFIKGNIDFPLRAKVNHI